MITNHKQVRKDQLDKRVNYKVIYQNDHSKNRKI